MNLDPRINPPDDLDSDDYVCAKCGRSGWSSDPYLREWEICERHNRELPLLLTDAHIRQWIREVDE